MTPKKKAEDLIDKMYRKINGETTLKDYKQAIQCTIITVDEILTIASTNHVTVGRNQLTDFDFWTEVKNELNKMQ